VSCLHVHRYGPPGPLRLLAIHGLTGHGQRWQRLATGHLPDISVAAPDLLGHGRSSWAAPWTIDANVTALAGLFDDDTDAPVVVVGHSFGGAVALHLAAAHPDRVGALVLLDPAIGLDGEWMRQIADAMLASPDYPDAAQARAEKAAGSWADVEPALLDAELEAHLVELPGGRYGWRISLPAMMSYWSELARSIMLPPKGIRTTLVRATRTVPRYVGDELIAGLRDRLGFDFELLDWDCEHMVAQARPADVAALIRTQLARLWHSQPPADPPGRPALAEVRHDLSPECN
jgi:lipase